MPVRLAMVCESPVDFRTASRLAERVFVESVNWVDEELLQDCPVWVQSNPGRPFLLWTEAASRAKELGIKPHGHFDGSPGEADAHAARRALLVLKHIHGASPPEGVILVRDDDRQTERRQGLEQGRNESKMRDRIVIGLAHCKRESWVLAAFDPADAEEESKLAKMRAELGFNPCTEAHQLTAKGDADKKSAKRVLGLLLDHAREDQCLASTDLKTLRERGKSTGLTEYLDEVRERQIPLFHSRGAAGHLDDAL